MAWTEQRKREHSEKLQAVWRAHPYYNKPEQRAGWPTPKRIIRHPFSKRAIFGLTTPKRLRK
jgi:hypothetical protein